MLGMDRHPYAPIQARCLIEQFGRLPNIEEVVTELGFRVEAARAAGIPANPSPCSPGNLRGWIGPWLRKWFRQIHTGTATAYAEFAKLVQAGDVIITFNSLDRELKLAGKWDVWDGYGFPFAARSSEVLILKLHGSMNWLWPVPFLGDRRNERPRGERNSPCADEAACTGFFQSHAARIFREPPQPPETAELIRRAPPRGAARPGRKCCAPCHTQIAEGICALAEGLPP